MRSAQSEAKRRKLGGKAMKTFEYGDPSASIVLIQPVDENDLAGMENEIREIRRLTRREFYLIAMKIEHWNQELSPWEAPAVFGKEGFGNGAGDTLKEILKLCADKEKTYLIGGYSLAALFALWVQCQTDVFQAVAAASPSVWFPGFVDYLKSHESKCPKVYLSLGDKEEKARNPVMATVGSRIRETQEVLLAAGVDCVLEWNRGNHFREPDIRTAKAFAWALDGKFSE